MGGIAVLIGSGGTVTPLIIGLAGGVGTFGQVMGGALIRGGFVFEELPADVLNGSVNGATAILTGGTVTATTTWGILRQTTINTARAGASAGALTSLVSTGLQTGTWEDGIGVGLLRVTQATAIGGALGGILGGALGGAAATFQVSGAAAYIRSVLPTWLTRPFASTASATFRETLEAELTTLINVEKQAVIHQVLTKLGTLPADASEATVRAALREVLGAETQAAWRELFEEAGVVTWLSTKGLAANEASRFFKDSITQTLLQQAETLDGLVQRLVQKGVAVDVARLNAISLGDDLSRLSAQATDAEVRAILQRLNPDGTISDDLVVEARQWLSEVRRELLAARAGQRPLGSSNATGGVTPLGNIRGGEVSLQELLADSTLIPGKTGAYLRVPANATINPDDLAQLTINHNGAEFMLTCETVYDSTMQVVSRRYRIYSGIPEGIPPPRFLAPGANGEIRVESIIGHTHPFPLPYFPNWNHPSLPDIE